MSKQQCGAGLLTDVKIGQFIQLIESHTKGDKGITVLDHVKAPAGRNTDFFDFFPRDSCLAWIPDVTLAKWL